MDNKTKNSPSRALALKTILVLGILLIFLIIVNSIDFSPLTSTDEPSATLPIITDVTYAQERFETPDFDKEISNNEYYLSKERGILFTSGNETFYIEDGGFNFNKYSAFFVEYFKALESGDADALNALYTDSFKKEHGLFAPFTKQMVYDKEVVTISSTVIEDRENSYYGYTRLLFSVSYKILDNDGTFRRDIIYDEVKPLVFELLEGSTTIRINSVGRVRHYTENPEDKDLITPIASLALGILFVVSSVIETITRKLWVLPIALSSLISFLAAMCGAKFILLSILFITLTVLLYLVRIFGIKNIKAFIKRRSEQAENKD